MQVAQIRKKAFLVLLDDFRFTVDGTSYALNTTIGTYFMNVTDLFAARLGQYVKCSYFPEPMNVPKTYEGLVAKAEEVRQEGCDWVAFVSTTQIDNPKYGEQARGLNWADWEEEILFVRFDKEAWEFMIRMGFEPFQSAIFGGQIWLMSHEINHLVAAPKLHSWMYSAMEHRRYYDDRFNFVSNPDWTQLNWLMIGVELPEEWQ